MNRSACSFLTKASEQCALSASGHSRIGPRAEGSGHLLLPRGLWLTHMAHPRGGAEGSRLLTMCLSAGPPPHMSICWPCSSGGRQCHALMDLNPDTQGSPNWVGGAPGSPSLQRGFGRNGHSEGGSARPQVSPLTPVLHRWDTDMRPGVGSTHQAVLPSTAVTSSRTSAPTRSL